MKRLTLFCISLLAATLPALAAPNCTAPQVAQGNNCTLTTSLGWIVAGQGNASIVNIYLPPNASGPVDFEVTGMSSSLGNTYTGYFGVVAGPVGAPGQIVTLSDVKAGAANAIGLIYPGQVIAFQITGVCWDPTCTSPAPAEAVPNMLRLQFIASSPNSADLTITPGAELTVQFLNASNQVTWEGIETAVRGNFAYNIIPGINLGATPATRYALTGSAVNQPFDTISITNLNNPNPISGTATLQDYDGKTIVSTPIPSIPGGGAAGYLLIGRSPGDTLGLFPSSTVLPASPDGVFHGALLISMNGLTLNEQCVVLSQEYNGNSMVNLPVFRSPVP